jgi:hypothetical protein
MDLTPVPGDVRRTKAGAYTSITKQEEDDEDIEELLTDATPFDESTNIEDSSSSSSQHCTTTTATIPCYNRTLVPDHAVSLYNITLVDGPAIVKLLKFIVVTALSILFLHWFIRFMDFEHNRLFVADLYVYESKDIVVDCIVFFVIGRMWQSSGIDHLVWIGVMLLGNLYASLLPQFEFLQHSLTLFELHCAWPWQLWLFSMVAIVVVASAVVLHVQYAIQHERWTRTCLEWILASALFLVPYAWSDYMHLHHWFVGWFIGMHCNLNTWWSRASMAWCWGLYVNGIAAYGRDPVLTCGYSYWLSRHMGCPYLDCYLWNTEHSPPNETHFRPMLAPDWRNCSADSYHP